MSIRCPLENSKDAEILLAYCSRELDAESAAVLERHAENCPACRDFAAGQQAVWKALDAWEPAPISPDFDRRLYRRIENEVSWWDLILRPFRPLLPHRGLPVAAAAALVILAGVLAERPAEVGPQVPETAQFETVAPEQAEHALQEMEAMREFSQLMRSEGDPRL